MEGHKSTKVAISNIPFQLHYKLTTAILVAFSSVLVFYHIFGPGPITCNRSESAGPIPSDYLQTLCQASLESTQAQTWASDVSEPEPEKIYQGFYPYVWLLLLCQAACFLVPFVVWKVIEGGRTAQLASVLGNANLADRDAKLKRTSGYVSDNFRSHDGYVLALFMCEVLNFVNALIQTHMVNWFFSGQVEGSQDVAYSTHLFPSSIKCTFHRIGASGLPQKHSVLCSLPLNVLHYKMVNFLKFWYGALAVIASLVLLYRLVWLCSTRLRHAVLLRHYRRAFCQYLLETNVKRFGFGDYYVMGKILENTHPVNLKDFLDQVHGSKDEASHGEPPSGVVTLSTFTKDTSSMISPP